MNVTIIVVNWNQWEITCACLESLFRIEYPSFRVVVCDNGSKDDSIERLKQWSEGSVDVVNQSPPKNRHLFFPPVPKPLSVQVVDVGCAEGDPNLDFSAPLTILDIGKNLGFAAAVNTALRIFTDDPECDFFWLLNNDTVVDANSLACLVDRAREDPLIGMVGSTVCDYWQTSSVQTLGGSAFNRWFCKPSSIGAGLSYPSNVGQEWVEARMSYVNGASMLVTASFVRSIGYMDEQFFLYFEEISWSYRAGDSHRLGYAPNSLVFHRRGQSTSRQLETQLACDTLLCRNRLVFARTYARTRVPLVYLGLLKEFLAAIVKGNRRKVRALSQWCVWRKSIPADLSSLLD